MEQLYLRRIKTPSSRKPRASRFRTYWQPRLITGGIALIFLIFAMGVMIKYIQLQKPGLQSATTSGQLKPTAVPPEPVTQGVLAPIFMPSVLRWEAKIVNYAWHYGFDPNLLAIIVQIESCGDPEAVSVAGAKGLGQVMPFHFVAGENPFDPDTNLNRAAAYYAAGLKSSNNNIAASFAGYNGGHGRIQRTPQNLWPAETQRYHEWATGIFWDIKNGLAESPTLQRWLGAGGASLCAQAENRALTYAP